MVERCYMNCLRLYRLQLELNIINHYHCWMKTYSIVLFTVLKNLLWLELNYFSDKLYSNLTHLLTKNSYFI